MPLRPFNREQTWLLPPTLDDLLPQDHPARFVAVFVDSLDHKTRAEMGIGLGGEPLGAPAYHPQALLGVWLYGFMTGVRSSRKLEGACRDQIPYLWLTGWQHPDHNTLWRFYRDHRGGMRRLLKGTVATAMKLGLVDLAVQAVDGTKVGASAAKDRTYDAKGLQKLLERTESAILDLEAQNEGGEGPPPPPLPQELVQLQELRKQVHQAMKQVAQEGLERVNLTDEDASLMKGRQGIVPGYNAQGVVSPLNQQVAPGSGFIITATQVVQDPDDTAQLLPMLEEAEAMTGERAATSLSDGGYYSGENLAKCAAEGRKVVMPEGRRSSQKDPYHRDQFRYQEATDSYLCPQGQRITFRGLKHRVGRGEIRLYGAGAEVCRECSAFGVCTKDRRQGRRLEVGPHESVIQEHRHWMATHEAKGLYKLRKELVEPVFGILKEQQGGRRFLLRGLAKVRAEWDLLAAAFNLRTLWRVWVGWDGQWPREDSVPGVT
jgi:transposase